MSETAQSDGAHSESAQPVPRERVSGDSRYWPVPVARGAVAILVAVAITFSPDHSPVLGYVSFGVLTIATGLILGILGTARLARGTERTFFVAQAIISVVAGVLSLIASAGPIAFLLVLASAYAAITGFLELYSGLRARRRFAIAKDWLFVGALTAVFAVIVLLIPGNFAQHFTGPDGVERVLTASVIIDGFIGAYAALLGVYLVIAGLSLKWGPVVPATSEAPTATQVGK